MKKSTAFATKDKVLVKQQLTAQEQLQYQLYLDRKQYDQEIKDYGY